MDFVNTFLLQPCESHRLNGYDFTPFKTFQKTVELPLTFIFQGASMNVRNTKENFQ